MNITPSDTTQQVADDRIESDEDQSGSGVSGDYVPSSFEDMFQHYYQFVVSLVATFGIDFQNSEDVAMAILTKFFEKDVLSDFDPNYTTKYGGVIRKAVFRTFLSGFVRAYVRHYKDRQALHRVREGFSVETPLFVLPETGHAVTWMEYAGPQYLEEFEELHEADLVRSIRDRLKVIQPRNAQDQCDMPRFFERVLSQIREHGRVETTVLAAEFGVSKTSIQNWLGRLRSEVSDIVKSY